MNATKNKENPPLRLGYSHQFIPSNFEIDWERIISENLDRAKVETVVPKVKSIKFDKKFTTVTWQDRTTTRVGRMDGDNDNHYEAFCAALAKKIYKTTSQVKHIVDTKDEQIEIDKQRCEREEFEKAEKIRKARKDRLWTKRRAKEIVLENAAQELAKKIVSKDSER